MNCEVVSELVPWAANGSLSPDESSAVADHLANCAKCRLAVEETKQILRSAQTHLPPDVLIEFAETRKLAKFDRGLFDDHLAICRECSEQLSLVAGSFAAIEETQPRVVVAPNSEPGWFAGLWASVRLWKYAAISAALLLVFATVGLFMLWQRNSGANVAQLDQEKNLRDRIETLEAEKRRQAEQLSQSGNESNQTIEELRKKVAEAEQRAQEAKDQANNTRANPPIARNEGGRGSSPYPVPQANVVVLDLFPASVTRSESANENRLRIPPGVRSVTLILNAGGPETFPRYSIELLNHSGRAVWRNPDLKRYSTSDFTISLPANLLRAGRHRINIYGQTENGRTLLGRFDVVIER